MSIKLADFGFATCLTEKELKDVLGSPIYMPPEIIRKEKYEKPVDVWSAGAVTYVLLTGKPPFLGNTKDEVYHAILKKELPLKIPELFNCSKNGVDFLSKVLVKDPSKRLTAKQALEHPWLEEVTKSSLNPNQDQGLQHVTHNLLEFSKATQFQKMVLSILSSLKVQQEELGYIKEQFLKLDTNLDGTLTVDELKEGLSKIQLFEMLCSQNIEEDTDPYYEILQKIDLDGDGKIDYHEFVQAAIDHRSLLNKDNIKAMFNLMDVNGDGIIDLQELKQTFKQQGDKYNQVFQEIISEVDKDQDNVISYEEFCDGMCKMLIKSFKVRQIE